MARRDEVEEFLRKAAARRQQAQGGQRGGKRQQQPQPFVPPPPPPMLVPIEAEVVDAELADTADQMATAVAQDFRGTQEIAEHTRRLGEEVDLADDKMAAHLQQVFDHRVGQLKTRATESAAQPASGPVAAKSAVTPVDLVQMLKSPQHVGNAIILGEILRRPEERW